MQEVAPQTRLQLPKEALAALLDQWGVRRALLFGSALHGTLKPDSDVDLVVEFEPGRTPGLAFFELEHALSDLLGRRVDLNTEGFLSPYFRDQVLAEGQIVYDASR